MPDVHTKRQHTGRANTVQISKKFRTPENGDAPQDPLQLLIFQQSTPSTSTKQVTSPQDAPVYFRQ